MISEKWSHEFDILKLQQHFQDFVLCKPITWQTHVFGGWSVLSSNGRLDDGWQKGHYSFDPSKTLTAEQKVDFKTYTKETEICFGYLKEIIDFTREVGLQPFRARIICLPKGSESVWHTDARPDQYAVRLHIPILTNSDCLFETETASQHLAADGSGYFFHVNRQHRVVNRGTTDRFHLVMNVIDTQGVTTFHQFK